MFATITILLTLIAIILLLRFRLFIKEKDIPMNLITTLILVSITIIYVYYTAKLSSSAENQISMQINHFKQTNRPYIFTSDWSEFIKYADKHTIGFKLENCGNLPAKFDTIYFNIIIGSNIYPIPHPDFKKPTVIFPNQKNMKIDLPIYNYMMPKIKENLGFIFELGMRYYSINDTSKSNPFSYFVKYNLKMNSPNSNYIDDYILLENSTS